MFVLRRSHTALAAWSSTYVAAALPTAITRTFHSSPVHCSIADMVEKVHTTERLAELRKLMREHKIDVYSTSRLHLLTAHPMD